MQRLFILFFTLFVKTWQSFFHQKYCFFNCFLFIKPLIFCPAPSFLIFRAAGRTCQNNRWNPGFNRFFQVFKKYFISSFAVKKTAPALLFLFKKRPASLYAAFFRTYDRRFHAGRPPYSHERHCCVFYKLFSGFIVRAERSFEYVKIIFLKNIMFIAAIPPLSGNRAAREPGNKNLRIFYLIKKQNDKLIFLPEYPFPRYFRIFSNRGFL